MDFFRLGPRRPQSELLVAPPPRRLSTPAGERLATILESNSDLGTHEHNAATPNRQSGGRTWSTRSHNGTLPRVSSEPMPPPYASREWQTDESRYFSKENEAGFGRLRKRRGGLGRACLVLVIVLIIAIALGVGLGVGLTRRSKSTSRSSSQPASSSTPDQQFPLGQYSFVSALKQVSTNCTSDPSTWRCYPYDTFENDNSTAGAAVFNWVLSASGSDPVTNLQQGVTTGASGVPANVMLSSSSNPFAITITNQSLTYFNDSNDPRYQAQFTHIKNVAPSSAVGSGNSASTCYFNQTTVTATIYLSASVRSKAYPGSALSNAAQVQGGFSAWPYPFEISETADGGTSVPNCYSLVNGNPGSPVGSFAVQPSSQQCECDYNNFDDNT